MSVCSNYGSAIDELNSHLTPTQFTYLIAALSESLSETENDDKLSLSQGELGSHTSLSSPSPSTLSEPSDDTSNGIPAPANAGKLTVRRSSAYHRTIADFQSTIPTRRLSRSRPPLIPLASMETVTGKSSVAIYQRQNTDRSSILALRGGGSVDESINQLIYQSEMKYDKFQLQVALPFNNEEVPKKEFRSTKKCSELRVCKKLLSKYSRGDGKLSRSSSTETVKAESLPDENNPLVNIAGRIANEPINPFPIMRKSNQLPSKSKTLTHSQPHFTDRSKIEEGVDQSLRRFQDYKDVSEFFSQNAELNGGGQSRNAKSKGTTHGKVCNLSRRVTNPLYKQYDPTGYHKSEDELALECIQMICNDFNAWIKSLAPKRKSEVESETVNESQNECSDSGTIQESIEIGPEFLIQILRTELELPENE